MRGARGALFVERVALGEARGNLQERARDARYALAERLAEGDYAAGHTASDQAETVLYRLAVSPGSRALHGMAPRRGRLVRPLLGVTREEVRTYLRSRGLEWREDPSNADRRFARARVRHDLMDALRTIGPAAERTIAETARQLREEAEVLDAAVADALGVLGGGPAVSASELGRLPGGRAPAGAAPPGRAGGRRARAGRHGADPGAGRPRVEVARPGRRRARGGRVRDAAVHARGPPAVPDPVVLTVPGRARFGDWEVEAGAGAAGRRERDTA